MSASTIYTAFRAILTGLSLDADPDGMPIEGEAQSLFTSRSDLDFDECRYGERAHAFKQNVNQRMLVRRGFTVFQNRDTSMKAWISAQETIISAFLAPSNRPSGCRKIEYIGSRKFEESAEEWIAEIEFEIEYSVSVSG